MGNALTETCNMCLAYGAPEQIAGIGLCKPSIFPSAATSTMEHSMDFSCHLFISFFLLAVVAAGSRFCFHNIGHTTCGSLSSHARDAVAASNYSQSIRRRHLSISAWWRTRQTSRGCLHLSPASLTLACSG